MVDVDHCADPAHVRPIPGAAQALARLRASGWMTIIITNQSGIGRGIFTVDTCHRVNAELIRQLDGAIDASYFCPDHPDRPTARRKPGTGMIEEAVSDHGIDTAGSWFVGDKSIDITCGRNAGCRTILVLTGADSSDETADFVARDVVEAIGLILENS